MGKSAPTSQNVNQTTQVKLPDWVNSAAQANLAQAQQVSQNLAGPYEGQRVANLTPGQLQTIQAFTDAQGMSQPAYNLAQLGAAGVMNYAPQQVQGADVAGNINQFMNPYVGNVIAPALMALDVQRQNALNQIGDQAQRAGAFGGSRQGIQEGVTNAGYGMQGASLVGNLLNQGYNTALGAAQQQAGLQQQANLANQQAGLQGQQLNLGAATGLGQLASGDQSSYLQSLQLANAAQNQLQQQAQQQLAAQQQLYQEQAQRPLSQLQVNLSALGMTPYGQTSSMQGTMMPSYMPGSPLMGAMGGALMGGQIAPMLGLGAGTGAIGGGLLGALAAI